jgi:shikimate 5-dehydrogenase
VKNILILGVGGEGRPPILQMLQNFNNVSVVPVTNEHFNTLMHINERSKLIEPNLASPDDMLNTVSKDYIGKHQALEKIIKRSTNPLEVLNASRELNNLKFNSGRKHTKRK